MHLYRLNASITRPRGTRELGNVARSFVQKFSWTKIASKHEHAYDAVLAYYGSVRSLEEPETSARYSTTFL